jgi:phosphatidylinositol glycan class B
MTTSRSSFNFVQIIILLGIALRIYAAIAHLDLAHMDEHFQNLEPASKVVFGYGWMSWEWDVGSRSWIVPALYMPVLWIFKILGFQGGPAPIMGCRVMMALMSGWMMFQFDRLLIKRELSVLTRGVAAVAYAFLPAFVAWGAATLSDTWAMDLLWIVFPFAVEKTRNKDRKSWFYAGLLLSLPFLVRLQMLLWPIGICVVLLFRKTPFKMLFSAFLGFLAILTVQTVVDWVTWGSPLQSVIMNVQKNLFENVAAFYGTAPFYDYFPELYRNMGGLFWIFFAAAALGAIFFRTLKLQFLDALVLIPSILYFVAHCLIGHKETRFMLPIYPSIFYLLALSVECILGGAVFPRLKPALWLLLPALGYASITDLYTPEHYNSFDLAELMTQVRNDGGLSSGRCIAFYDHYWVWSHGELLQGLPVHFIEISSNRAFPTELQSCIYAVMPPGRGQSFEARAGASWKKMGEDSRGELVYKNSSS